MNKLALDQGLERMFITMNDARRVYDMYLLRYVSPGQDLLSGGYEMRYQSHG